MAPKLRSSLAEWFERNKRDLPWRRLASLYPTVVSEFMLQQTQVKTVLPYFDHWLKRFPDFRSLSRAREETVLKHWEGFGYYSRARNLHQLAKDISKLETIPTDPETWQKFKGIGAYTAAAVTSITYKHPVACVDGNVIRILCRLTADKTVYKDNNQAMKAFTPLAAALLDSKEPGRHNEAMMELGATLCTKAKPKCSECPLAHVCLGKDQQPERLPKKVPRKVKIETIDRAWVLSNDRLLLHKTNGKSRRLPGILELPTLELLGQSSSALKKRGLSPFTTRKRGISNSQITEPIWILSDRSFVEHEELIWIELDKLDNATLSGPHKRWIEGILKDNQIDLI